MNIRRIPLIIGLLLAAGTGVLLLNYLASVRGSAEPSRTVLVAAAALTPGMHVTDAMVTTSSRPTNVVDPDALTDRRLVVGKVALIGIPEGGVFTQDKVGADAAAAVPGDLPVGMRAVSIAIDRVKGVSGLVAPGDRVDVIAVPPRVGNETPVASTILRGVLIVALGGSTGAAAAEATPNPDAQSLTTVTLAVTPQQADLLAAADVSTTLRLALRPKSEPVRAERGEPLHLPTAPPLPQQAPPLTQQMPPAMPQTVAAVPPPAPQPSPRHRARRGSTVMVIDGDQVEDTQP
ncbi:MAG: Flp pilus assembly protein CpaB [Candidatus Eremiobacteraeota bacterium]|nr:Flp pilus assembly protein CpaB [Candidatus Eremiobacteraeota bacterium]